MPVDIMTPRLILHNFKKTRRTLSKESFPPVGRDLFVARD